MTVTTVSGQVAMDAEVITCKAVPLFPAQPEVLAESSAIKMLTHPLDLTIRSDSEKLPY